MKGFIIVLGLVAALAGYMSYPAMRYQLTGLAPIVQPKPAAATTPQATPDSPTPPAIPAASIPAASIPAASTPAATIPAAINLAMLTPDQLPAQVTLKVTTEVADASGLKMKIDPGNRLKLVRLEGDQVVVSPGTSPFEGRVPVSGTDLMEQLAANPPVITPTTPVTPAEPAAPVTPAAPATQPEPPPSLPAIVPPVAEPSPPVPSANVPAPGTAVDVVEVMKAHIRSGAIKEFTFEQVLDWKIGTDEVVNGQTYQTGLVSYKAETIFGVKTIEAKALIQNGRIVRWVWPKSGMEIK